MDSFVEQILRQLRIFFEPIEEAVSSPERFEAFLREFGHDTNGIDPQAAINGLGPLSASIDALAQAFDAPEEEDGADDAVAPSELTNEDLIGFADAARQIFDGLRGFPTLLSGRGSFAEIWDYLVAEYLFEQAPPLFRALVFLGVIEMDMLLPGTHAEARDVPYLRRRVRWGRLSRFLSEPSALMQEVYGWNTAEFDSDLVLTRLADVFDEFGFATSLRDLDPVLESRFLPPTAPPSSSIGVELPLLQEVGEEEEDEVEFGLLALPIKGQSDDDTGIGLMPYTTGSFSPTLPLSHDGSLKITVQVSGEIAGAVVFAVRPSGPSVEAGIDSLAASASMSVDLSKTPPPGSSSLILLGEAGATRLEASSLVLSVGGDATSAGEGDLFVAAGAGGLKLVIDPAEDGLLGALVRDPIEASAGDVLVGWRPGRGIYFEQSSGLGLRIPIDVKLGSVLRLHELGLGLLLDEDPGFEIDVSGDLTIGPLILGLERLGMKLRFPEDADGIFGKYGLDAGLKVPSGYLVSLDGGPFKGGGALSIQDHEYRGMLALEFESFGLSAFGILTTRMPSGADGFAFLASIFGQLDVQLGFGFRLTGLGGLLGVHRTADIDELRDVLAAGRLDNLLFPPEPMQDAMVILEDMASVFPAKTDQHIFGPMAKITWGTPALVEGKLGVVLEFGREERLVILGAVGSFLPSRDAAIVEFNFDFIGTIEFSTGAIDFRGNLNNSRILTWPVSGEAAVQTGWGESADLVSSVGGLHPAYPTPPGFPSLARLTINFGTDNPSLTLQAYMALTLNSVQAGAHASLYKRGPKIIFVGRFEVEGWAGFDALITFDPFTFDAALSLGLRLLLDGDVLCGISGDLRLKGPNNYVIRGKVSVEVCGVGVSVGVNHSWGTKLPEPVQRVNGLDLLRRALQTAKGLEPVASSTLRGGVAYAEDDSSQAAAVRLDPSGGLRFVQRALPLDVRLDHIGSSRLSDGLDRFDIEVTDDNDQVIDARAEEGAFPAGVFFDLSDGEKLSGDPFARHKAGVSLHAADVLEYDTAAAEGIDDEYETLFLGDKPGSNQVLADGVRPAALWVRYVATRTEPGNPDFVPVEQRASPIRLREMGAIVAELHVTRNGVRARVDASNIVIAGSRASLSRRFPDARIVARHLSTAGV